MMQRDQFQFPSDIAPSKAIVFTQWSRMLDLLEHSLSSNHIEFRRLDGSMPLNVRERAVKEFNTDPEVAFYNLFSLAS